MKPSMRIAILFLAFAGSSVERVDALQVGPALPLPHLPTHGRFSPPKSLEVPAPPNSGAFAPDGKRGLASSHDLGELLRVFRQPSDADRALLNELYGIEGKLATLIGLARERYEAQKYFELCAPSPDHDVFALHDAFRAAEAKSLETLTPRDARAEAFSRAYFDMRLRLRMQVVDGYADELRELKSGLAVLRGATDGAITLLADEGHAIAVRVDLAASRLRAMQADLLALRTPDGEPEIDPDSAEKAKSLLELAGAPNQDRERNFQLATWIEEISQRKAQMSRVLNTKLLEPRLAPFVQWREKIRAAAKKEREEAAKEYLDATTVDTASPEVKKIGKSNRMKFVGEHATRGITLDPLDEELSWYLAKATQFFDADVYSRPWFDRYLALRDIRASEWRTLKERRLTAREQEALTVVQGTAPPPTK